MWNKHFSDFLGSRSPLYGGLKMHYYFIICCTLNAVMCRVRIAQITCQNLWQTTDWMLFLTGILMYRKNNEYRNSSFSSLTCWIIWKTDSLYKTCYTITPRRLLSTTGTWHNLYKHWKNRSATWRAKVIGKIFSPM